MHVLSKSRKERKLGIITISTQCRHCMSERVLVDEELLTICLLDTSKNTIQQALEDTLNVWKPIALPDLVECTTCTEKSGRKEAVKMPSANKWVFKKAPKNLCIVLERYKMVKQKGQVLTKKSTKQMKYTTELTLNDSNYRLESIITHSGDSLKTGHYVTYGYVKTNRHYYKFDDIHVEKICDPEFFQHSKNVYILFYHLNDSPDEQVEIEM